MGQAEDRGRGVYAISVAAELVGTGQQNLRLYERKGLLEPGRTLRGTRQYSEDDNRRLEGELRTANAPRDIARHPARRG